jgi:DNA polymerase III sliding clamp (beta) subunit (PCNA family)
MTMTEPTTTRVGGFVDAELIRAACACASTDKTRPMLTSVAFTLNGDRFDVQATDSHVAFWSGDVPADEGHILIDAKELGAFLRSARAKGLVGIKVEDGRMTLTTGRTPDQVTLAVLDASFPRLKGLVSPTEQEVGAIGLGTATMSKVIATAKALNLDAYKVSFRGRGTGPHASTVAPTIPHNAGSHGADCTH